MADEEKTPEARLAEANAKLAAAELRALKSAAAAKVGLSPVWGARLLGDDAMAIEADARALMAQLGGGKVAGGTSLPNPQVQSESMSAFLRRK